MRSLEGSTFSTQSVVFSQSRQAENDPKLTSLKRAESRASLICIRPDQPFQPIQQNRPIAALREKQKSAMSSLSIHTHFQPKRQASLLPQARIAKVTDSSVDSFCSHFTDDIESTQGLNGVPLCNRLPNHPPVFSGSLAITLISNW